MGGAPATLFTMVVFTLIFGGLAQMPSEGSVCALLLLRAAALDIFPERFNPLGEQPGRRRAPLEGLHPGLFIPTAPCLAGLVDYAIAMVIMAAMMVYYQFVPPVTIILLPLIVLLTFLLASGMGYWLSSICVKYRDVKFVLPFFVQLLMFVSPVIYPADIVGGNLQWLLSLNPLTGLLNAHRAVLLGHVPVNYAGLAISAVIALVIFISGILYLRRTEKYFADLV